MIQDQISEIHDTLSAVFAEVDNWFAASSELNSYRPLNGGWTVGEILEHIALTNFFLLKLIEKGASKALRNVNNLDLQQELEGYEFHMEHLFEIGSHQSFLWIRPEHMEPKGIKALSELRLELASQEDQCHRYLEDMPNGEGVLYKTTMTVNNLGKLDVYQYIFFLAMHAKRHIQQMDKNREEFEAQKIIRQ